ncbi:MAG: hypothetical protein E7397_09430 [Ruminococcaceae bacterium]|nr:hypothetical protein [Oscillospiraceae bacterium]
MKKIKTWKLFICILAAMMLTIASAYAQDAFAWLEAENGTVSEGSYRVVTIDEASGQKGMDLFSTEWSPSQIDLTFNVEEAGDYDIKILTSMGHVGHLSKFLWCIDEEDFSYCPSQMGAEVYKYVITNIGTYQTPVCWYSLGSRSLTAGEHTISIRVEDFRNNQDWMFHYFDVVVVVPSSWQWTPVGIERPVEKKLAKNRFTWINMGEVISNENKAQPGVNVSGATISVQSVQPEGTVYDFEVPFRVKEAGEYDIYFSGGPPDVAHASRGYYLLDGVEKGKITEGMNYRWMAYAVGAPNGLGMQWQRIEQMMLDTNEHTITFRYPAKRTMDESYLIALQYMVIVPKGTEFGFTNTDDPAIATGEILMTDIFIEETEISEAPPLHMMTLNGIPVQWSVDKPEYFDINAGEVIQPGYYDESVDIVLTASFDITEGKYSATITKSFPLTIVKKDAYSVKNFLLEYENGKKFGENSDTNKKLTAKISVSNNTNEEKQAVLLLLLYDETGKLIKVGSQAIGLTAELQEICAEILVEEEKEGYAAEVCLWTDMQEQAVIQDTVHFFQK